MTSPARISWRLRDSSNSAAKLSSKEAGVAVDIEKKNLTTVVTRRLVEKLPRPGGLRKTSATKCRSLLKHEIDRLLDGHFRCIEQRCILASFQRRDGALGIPSVAITQVTEQIVHTSRHSFIDQLLISTLGAR